MGHSVNVFPKSVGIWQFLVEVSMYRFSRMSIPSEQDAFQIKTTFQLFRNMLHPSVGEYIFRQRHLLRASLSLSSKRWLKRIFCIICFHENSTNKDELFNVRGLNYLQVVPCRTNA